MTCFQHFTGYRLEPNLTSQKAESTTAPHVVKILKYLYGITMFIITFTKACYFILLEATYILFIS